MKKTTRSLIVLLIIAMFMFIGCDDTLNHDMNDDVEVDEDEQVVATSRTITWMNYDGKVLKTAEVEKGQAPDHPDDLNPTPPAPTYRLHFDDLGNLTVTEDIVYQYKFKEWFSHDQNRNYKDQVFTATYDTYGPGSESHPDGELADLTDFTFKSSISNPYARNTGHFCYITEYTGTDKENLYIPKFHNGELVVEVNVDFRGKTDVVRLIIPDSVLNLASDFEKNVNLRRLVVSDNLQGIPMNSFKGCTSLYKIDIPEGVETSTYASEAYTPRSSDYFDKRIGYEAFAGCTNLVSVDVPDAMQEIGDFAFAGCTNLQTFKMPIFADPEDPENNTSNLTKIERAAFKGCKRLNAILIPDTVEEIGYESFFGCSSLKQIIVPPKVKKIDHMAFMLCTSLRTITLSEGLETINSRAFEECRALEELKIPSTVTTINIDTVHVWKDTYWEPYRGEAEEASGGILVGCESLRKITVSGDNVYRDRGCNVIYHYDDRTLIAGCMKSTIPTGTKHIANFAFDGHTGLKNDPGIDGNPTLESIGARAFWDCLDNGALQNIYLGKKLTEIRNAAFYHEPKYATYTDEDGVEHSYMYNATHLFTEYTDKDYERGLFDYRFAIGQVNNKRGVGLYLTSPEWKLGYHLNGTIWTDENKPENK
ncbi:MAG TPA: leucine-rich repeat domain-containing protein [Bacteroidales bacterium]|nr:leucine-rich repeat domain-containing protein [Bacteroidales bacterium]